MFVQLRHDMRRIPRAEMPKRSIRRMQNAQKTVDRELYKVALFPELARFKTAEERLDNQDRITFESLVRQRQVEADAWIKVRRRMRQLSQDKQARFLKYWNKAFVPAEGVNACGALFHMFPRPEWYREDMMKNPGWDTPLAQEMIRQNFEKYFGEKFREEFPDECCFESEEVAP